MNNSFTNVSDWIRIHKISFDKLIYGTYTDKNSSVCLIRNMKTRHGYVVTWNLCKVELATTSKL
jgi:hypothetical protein